MYQTPAPNNSKKKGEHEPQENFSGGEDHHKENMA